MRTRVAAIIAVLTIFPSTLIATSASSPAGAAPNQFRTEAEVMTFSGSGAVVSSSGAGFSGSGYVIWNGEASLSAALALPQGTYRVEVRYRAVSGPVARTLTLSGSSAVPVTFAANSTSWSGGWSTVSVSVVAGPAPQTLRLAGPGTGRVDVDRVEFVPTFEPVTLQAESWSLSGAGPAVRTSPAGFTGSGFVGSWSAPGTSAAAAVSFPAGVYTVSVRYRNAAAAAARTVQLNGLPVATVALPKNADSWSSPFTAAAVNVMLPPGPVRFALANVDGSAVDLDSVTFRFVGPPSTGTATHQPESWTLSGTGVRVVTDNGGFTGTGYVGRWNVAGSAAATTLSPAAGLYLVTYRYRLAGSAPSTRTVSVAGAAAGTVVFKPNTTLWTSTSWATAAQLVTFPGGPAEFRLMSSGTDPLDLDRVTFSAVSTAGVNVVPVESMSLTGTQMRFARTNGGFQDFGYLSGAAAGEKVSKTLNVPAGSYTVSLRYRNAGVATSRRVTVNGSVVAQLSLAKNAAAWTDDKWSTVSAAVTLPAGAQVVELVVPSGATAADLDTLTVAGRSSTAAPASASFQAEDMTFSGVQLMKISTDNPAWEGTGYVGMWGMAGETLTRQLSLPAGTYTVSLRYRNADSAATRSVRLNGVEVATAALPKNTDAWTNNVWSTATVTVAVSSAPQNFALVNPDGDWSNWVDLDTVTFSSTTSTTTTSTPGATTTTSASGGTKRCIVQLHGKGGWGSPAYTSGSITYVAPDGNSSGWGGRQWLYFPDAGFAQVRDVVQASISHNGCGQVIVHGFSNGAAAAAKLYCRGERFNATVVGYIVDDPVTDHGVDNCARPSGVKVRLYWTGALAGNGAGWDCALGDWTCEGGSLIGATAYAQALGTALTQSANTSHVRYLNPPEYSTWWPTGTPTTTSTTTSTTAPTTTTTTTTPPSNPPSTGPAALGSGPLPDTPTGGTTYVVARGGSDAASCTAAAPCASIYGALARLNRAGGDTILIRSGSHNACFADVNGVNGTPSRWTLITAYPGETPVLRCSNTPEQWTVLRTTNSSYISFRGLTLDGENQTGELSGIVAGPGSHHIRVWGNTISNFPAAGIGGIHTSNLDIRNNRVSNNAYYSCYGASGITIWESANIGSPDPDGYTDRIIGNVLYNNRQLSISSCIGASETTDGNAIIIDTQDAVGYTGRTLIANNLTAYNGGRGVHVFASSNVDIVNNTSWHDGRIVAGGGISTIYASNVRVLNNVAVASPGNPAYSIYSASNITFANNVWSGAGDFARSASDLVVSDPSTLFVAPSDNPFAAGADWRPRPVLASRGARSALGLSAPEFDVYGQRRPSQPSIGAADTSSLQLS